MAFSSSTIDLSDISFVSSAANGDVIGSVTTADLGFDSSMKRTFMKLLTVPESKTNPYYGT